MHLREDTTVTIAGLAEGAAGTRQTLRLMRDLVRAGKIRPRIREKALELLAGLPQKNFAAQVKALFAFVRDSVRYVHDIRGIETVQTPEKTLDYLAGDCDDKCTLLAALLESVGHPTRFIAVGKSIGQFSHVYVETLIGKNWVALDPTEPVEMGWSPHRRGGVMFSLKVHN